MAEIIGITASVLTLIQAAGLAIDGACALKRKIDGAPKALDSAIEYLELIRLKLVLVPITTPMRGKEDVVEFSIEGDDGPVSVICEDWGTEYP
jgi:hypothetical protein